MQPAECLCKSTGELDRVAFKVFSYTRFTKDPSTQSKVGSNVIMKGWKTLEHRNTRFISSAAYSKAIYKAILNQNSTSTLVIPGTVESCDEWIERCDEWIEGFKSVRQSARHV